MEQAVSQHRRYTLEEYFQLEAGSEQRYEYYGGEIVAMAGGSPEHALIMLNVGGEMRSRLKGTSCLAYSSELRIRIPGTPVHLYPDASVICGRCHIPVGRCPLQDSEEDRP